MKKLIFYVSIFAMLVFTTSCNKESFEVTTIDAKETITPTDISKLPADVQVMIQGALSREIIESDLADQSKSHGNVKGKADVLEYGPDDELGDLATGDVTGHSKVTRTADGVHVKWHSIGLTPGDAVTIWIILFSQDGDCMPGFVDVLWGGGGVVNPGGVFNLEIFLANGDNSGSLIGGPGMENAYDFGLHMINRTHGENIEGSGQLTTFGVCPHPAGCEDLSESIHYVCP